MIFKKAVVQNVIKDALKISGNFFAKVFTAVKVVGPSRAVAISCEL
jgi:hypothetical protein